MAGISDYFSDEISFFDKYILNAPVLSASTFNVTKDTMLTCLATSKFAPGNPPEGFYEYALSFCPGIADQSPKTRDFLLKSAAMVGDKETQVDFLRHFSHEGILKLFGEGRNEYYLVYDMHTPKVTHFAMTQVVIMKDMESGDLIASFITKDLSRLRQFRKIATMAVNSVCECIALINAEERTITFETVSGELARLLPGITTDNKISYDNEFCDLICSVGKSDGDIPLRDIISVENITKQLEEKDAYIIIFDVGIRNGEVRRKQVMFQWYDSAHRFIATLQSDVSMTYRQERNHLDKLNHDLNLKLGKDQVTGLPNKNSSEIRIQDNFDPKNSSILLFDLTNLVYLNNTLGRDIGNMLLYQFAHLVSGSLPAGSFIGRYTGAELIVFFNVLRPGAEKDYLDRIEQKIEQYNGENPDCPIEYVYSAVFAEDYDDCDFAKLYAEAFKQLNDAKSRKGIPQVAEGDLSFKLMEMSGKTKELEYTSKHDGLTGLLNKTAGLDEIKKLADNPPHRYHVMFVLDVDDFKHINDTYGHDFGDEILKKLAGVLKAQFRPSDILVRYGGDEFIAFMADVSGPAQIEDKARSIIEAVDNMLFESGCRKTGFDPSNETRDTSGISIGIVWTDKHANSSKMFVQADSALYDAKHMGKNRFEITRNMGIGDIDA